jgi:hypothetical protein
MPDCTCRSCSVMQHLPLGSFSGSGDILCHVFALCWAASKAAASSSMFNQFTLKSPALASRSRIVDVIVHACGSHMCLPTLRSCELPGSCRRPLSSSRPWASSCCCSAPWPLPSLPRTPSGSLVRCTHHLPSCSSEAHGSIVMAEVLAAVL